MATPRSPHPQTERKKLNLWQWFLPSRKQRQTPTEPIRKVAPSAQKKGQSSVPRRAQRSPQRPQEQVKSKVGKQTIDNGVDRQRYTPFEDSQHLATLLRIALRGRRTGAYLLKKGLPGRESFRFVFGFECQGIHTTLKSEQIDPTFDAIEAGLKDLPPGEQLTLNLQSFSSDSDRQQQLDELFERSPSDELRFLALGEKKRVRELTQQGTRKPKRLRIYTSYTVQSETATSDDWLERIIAWGVSLWQHFIGEFHARQNQRVETAIAKAFTDGYQNWEQLLSNKMGLDIQPLSEQKMWADLWERFNDTEPREIPHLVELDERGLREEVIYNYHPTTVLLESESSLPKAQRRYIRLKDKYVGILTFLEKPGGWRNKWKQLKYLWDVVAREQVRDVEIICQLTRANETLVKTSVQRVMKQSNVAAQLASDKKSIDVVAQLKTRKSVTAQEELYEGGVPVRTAVTFLVYRDNLDDLDEACRHLQSYFLRPAWVIRETEYAWKVWLQTLPIVWENLLAKPFDRRQLYLTSEALGLMPLVRTRSGDTEGFELISEEGGNPVFIDLYKQHKNMAIFATTRAGKSVMAGGIMTQALSRGIPVVALDYPKPDGSSTFTDYTHFMGRNGAYFDIGKEASNIFEIPDLRALPPDKQEERFEDYKAFLESALMTMIFGIKASSEEDLLIANTRAILGMLLNRFFSKVSIQQRYEAAIEAGFDTAAWMQMPTLADFLEFCSPESLQREQAESLATKSQFNFDDYGTKADEALQQIRMRLRYWLTSSRVGRSISNPSSFRSDAPLLVLALRNLSAEADAAVMGLVAYGAALRRALSHPVSIFFIDESPILFEFPTIANLIGRLCANGAKAGIRVIISAQDPDTIAKSPAASKIFQNMSTKLIGRIQPSAVDSFVEILKYDKEIIGRNATESFFPKKEGIYSQWLLDDNGIFTYCRYYPSFVLLGAVANNPEEQNARTQYLESDEDKLTAMLKFSRYLVGSIRQS